MSKQKSAFYLNEKSKFFLDSDLKNIYLDEFNELFCDILKYPGGKFINTLIKRVKMTYFSKFNELPNSILSNDIEKYLIEIYYPNEYKHAYETMKLIRSKYEISNNDEKKIYEFNGNFIRHCHNCTQPLHTCNLPLYSNKSILNSLNKNNENNNNNKYYVVCLKCNQIYKTDFIKMNCLPCSQEFYTKLLTYQNKSIPATWKKYHCNAIINDKMRCKNCDGILFMDNNNINNVKCFNCNLNIEANKINWKCIICHQIFNTEAKPYNPLEFKIMKIAVKDTLINRLKAIPNENGNVDVIFKCGCKIDFNHCKFYHKKQCHGQLLKGIMNKRKIIVCCLCKSLNYYDNFIWMCPICEQRSGFNIKNNINHNNNNNNMKRNKSNNNLNQNSHRRDYSNLNVPIVHCKNRSPSGIRYQSINKDDNNKNNKIEKMKFVIKKNVISERGTRNNSKDYSLNNSSYNNNTIKIPLPYKNKQYKENNITVENKENNSILGNININLVHVKQLSQPKLDEILKINIDNNFKNVKEIGKIRKSPKHFIRNQLLLEKKLYQSNSFKNLKNIIPIPQKIKDNIEKEKEKKLEQERIEKEKKLEQERIEKEKKLEQERIEKEKIIKQKEEEEKLKQNKNNNDNNNNKPKESIRKKRKLNQEQTKSISEKMYIDYNFNSEDYEIKKKIGEGSFGKIYLVERNGKSYAMKKLIATSEIDFEALQHEYDILKEVTKKQNMNIINILGMQRKKLDRTTIVMYILMELAESDWEREVINRSRKLDYYTEEFLIDLLKKLVSTFYILQKEKISHRDIKPQNILICYGGEFKIADFGEAKELLRNVNTDLQTIRGTELFMSPILFNACKTQGLDFIEHNTYKSDVYSLGLCFLVAANLNFNALFEMREINDSEIIEKIIRRSIGKKYSEKFISILLKMLQLEENKRCDFIELNKILEDYDK